MALSSDQDHWFEFPWLKKTLMLQFHDIATFDVKIPKERYYKVQTNV